MNKRERTRLTFGALAMRVEIGDDRSRSVFQAEESGADQSFALG